MSREGKVVVEHYEPTETALANPGHFANMVCYQCGEKGRRRTDCPQDKCKFSGLKCELCKQEGHNKELCWEDAKNEHRRPRGWVTRLKKTKTEEEASATFIKVLV